MARRTSSRRSLLHLISAAPLMHSVFSGASASGTGAGCRDSNDFAVIIATANFDSASRDVLKRVVDASSRPPESFADGPTPGGMIRLRAGAAGQCGVLREWAAEIKKSALDQGVTIVELGEDIGFTPEPETVLTPGIPLEAFTKAVPHDFGYGFDAVGIEKAWTRTKGSPDVVVGIVDNGLELAHPLLSPNLWVNGEEMSGSGEPSNGISGDLHGVDFSASGSSGVGYQNVATEDCRHGTDAAYVVGGIASQSEGCAGIAPSSKLLTAKFTDGHLARDFDLARAVEYAAFEGAAIVNISSAIPAAELVATKRAIDYAATLDVLVVSAAGDTFGDLQQFLYYPAAYSLVPGQLPNQIVVMSAVTKKGMPISGSQTYSKTGVHIAAPIDSFVPGVPGTRSDKASGSSISAPYVSGIAALVKSLNPKWWNYTKLRTHLLESGQIHAGLKDLCQSEKLVDADRAVRGPIDIKTPAQGAILDPAAGARITWRKRYTTTMCADLIAELLLDGEQSWRFLGTAQFHVWEMPLNLSGLSSAKGKLRLRSPGSNFLSETIAISIR